MINAPFGRKTQKERFFKLAVFGSFESGFGSSTLA